MTAFLACNGTLRANGVELQIVCPKSEADAELSRMSTDPCIVVVVASEDSDDFLGYCANVGDLHYNGYFVPVTGSRTNAVLFKSTILNNTVFGRKREVIVGKQKIYECDFSTWGPVKTALWGVARGCDYLLGGISGWGMGKLELYDKIGPILTVVAGLQAIEAILKKSFSVQEKNAFTLAYFHFKYHVILTLDGLSSQSFTPIEPEELEFIKEHDIIFYTVLTNPSPNETTLNYSHHLCLGANCTQYNPITIPSDSETWHPWLTSSGTKHLCL